MTHFAHILIHALYAAVLALALAGGLRADEPEPQYTREVTVINVVDGDTVDVEIKTVVRVRILDLWAPETRTRDLQEKKRGLAAKDRMKELALGKTALLKIPLGKEIGDSLTLGRVLGWLWIDGKDVSEVMRDEGHGTKTKDGD